VERYAWFGAMENLQGVNPANALMTSSGKINALGEQYISGNGSANLSNGGVAPTRPTILFGVVTIIGTFAGLLTIG